MGAVDVDEAPDVGDDDGHAHAHENADRENGGDGETAAPLVNEVDEGKNVHAAAVQVAAEVVDLGRNGAVLDSALAAVPDRMNRVQQAWDPAAEKRTMELGQPSSVT